MNSIYQKSIIYLIIEDSYNEIKEDLQQKSLVYLKNYLKCIEGNIAKRVEIIDLGLTIAEQNQNNPPFPNLDSNEYLQEFKSSRDLLNNLIGDKLRWNSKSAWSSYKSNINSVSMNNQKSWKLMPQYQENVNEETKEKSIPKIDSTIMVKEEDRNPNSATINLSKWIGLTSNNIKLKSEFAFNKSLMHIGEIQINQNRLLNIKNNTTFRE